MFGYFEKSNSQAERSNSGYYCGEQNEVISKVMEYARRHRFVVLILCGCITDNYDSFLHILTSQMYNGGLIGDQSIDKRDLLPILSGDMSMEGVVRGLVGNNPESRKVCYISSFHQMGYNRSIADILLRKFQSLLVADQIMALVVLHIPNTVYETVKSSFRELCDLAVCYRTEQADKIMEEIRAPSGSGVQTELYSGRERPLERKVYPWYTQNLDLFKTEKDGMVMWLNHKDVTFELAALPQSKRLNWKFAIEYSRSGISIPLKLRIIYLENFSEDNSQVGIVIENANLKLRTAIRKSRWCERFVYNDPEFMPIFVIRGIYKGNNKSAAAAALEGLVELLDSLTWADIL